MHRADYTGGGWCASVNYYCIVVQPVACGYGWIMTYLPTVLSAQYCTVLHTDSTVLHRVLAFQPSSTGLDTSYPLPPPPPVCWSKPVPHASKHQASASDSDQRASRDESNKKKRRQRK
ncbi:hypothetical protein BU24DRAFT_147855 [Aaosphaeria arxii CBS 175.79]|uniref:Uncharacterized protein n=1 Tax=Aaosphaeria arxii CBS 175.79 TaxID=1450172 RepID=A0A6A5XVE7_9PLEO|nr:uncharacterized protein BU24DRAFT_147855 [Aaosphaeria arxii CBS 175.79]KAF2017298.1 hypothetical protein BU24DRAFT_147855 [Aaosphaeria arxii CBS 175.79]